MADLTYDPNTPRRPLPIASSPFMSSAGAYPAPGLGAPSPDPGMQIPTPMGWLSPEMAGRMLNHMAPNRDAIADTLGMPMDGIAWVARRLGAKGIPGGYSEARGDFITQAMDSVMAPGRAPPPVWRPGADVPLSSEHIRHLFNQYVPRGGLF